MRTETEQAHKSEIEAFIADMKKSGLSITGESVLFQRLLDAENWRDQFAICSFQGWFLGIEFSISKDCEMDLYEELSRYDFSIDAILNCLPNISGFSTEKLIFKLASGLWGDQYLSALQAQKQRVDDACSKDADRSFIGTTEQITEMVMPGNKSPDYMQEGVWLKRTSAYVEAISDIFVFARDRHGFDFGLRDYLQHLNLVNAIKLYYGWVTPNTKIDLPDSVTNKLMWFLGSIPGLDWQTIERIGTDESLTKIESFLCEWQVAKLGIDDIWGIGSEKFKLYGLSSEWDKASGHFDWIAKSLQQHLYLLCLILTNEQENVEIYPSEPEPLNPSSTFERYYLELTGFILITAGLLLVSFGMFGVLFNVVGDFFALSFPMSWDGPKPILGSALILILGFAAMKLMLDAPGIARRFIWGGCSAKTVGRCQQGEIK